jgi:hypothetical protein
MDWMRALGVAFGEFGKVIPKFWRLARELFHEVTGFLFLALALWFVLGNQGLLHSIRSLNQESAGPRQVAEFLAVLAGVLILAGFGISSFLRARRVSRDPKGRSEQRSTG